MKATKAKWHLRTRVEVEWRDSATTGSWHQLEKYRELTEDVLTCRSIGYVLISNKDRLVLMQSQSAHSASDAITIPRESIVKMRKLTGGL